MNINSEYNKEGDGVYNAIEAMDACMSTISEILINPAVEKDEIDLEQAKILGTVSEALQTIAQKAYAFEKMEELKGNDFGRN